jgi:hypothetical protein
MNTVTYACMNIGEEEGRTVYDRTSSIKVPKREIFEFVFLHHQSLSGLTTWEMKLKKNIQMSHPDISHFSF